MNQSWEVGEELPEVESRINWWVVTVISVFLSYNDTHLQRLYHIIDDRTLDLIDELELEKDEDAPMSMAAHPDVRDVYLG